MWKTPQEMSIFNELKRYLVDMGENAGLGKVEQLFDKALQSRDNYATQMALKKARSKGPYGAFL